MGPFFYMNLLGSPTTNVLKFLMALHGGIHGIHLSQEMLRCAMRIIVYKSKSQSPKPKSFSKHFMLWIHDTFSFSPSQDRPALLSKTVRNESALKLALHAQQHDLSVTNPYFGEQMESYCK